MGLNKTTSLRVAFWKFLIFLIIGLFCAVVIPFVFFWLSVNFGITNYANYSENSVRSIAPVIATAPDFSEVELPNGCRFLRIDKSYQFIETTLTDEELKQAMNYATTGTLDSNLNKQYLLVTRDDEFVILQYYIDSEYTNEWLNKNLPSPEIILYIMIGIGCITVCIFLTARFSKHLRSQLRPLFEATSEVSKQNLDFDVGHSKIKEFEDVLISFTDMKSNLKNSLEQQWKAEQLQKEQIAALAHDLKTPLTVIQGNIDLINETNIDEEQKLYAGYISDSSEQMQSYIKILIDISRASMGYKLHISTIEVSDFLNKIVMQINALCLIQNIKTDIQMYNLPKQITVDMLLLERAIMNIVNNAVEHSSEDGTIFISIIGQQNLLEISIIDDGIGFSEEALKYAKEQFYMSDSSRSNKMHFGMGLYIANSIIEQHGGKLHLENISDDGGAKVIMQLFY